MKIALGTAQMGLAYGVANSHGQMSTEEVQRTLSYARERGVDTLDTAIDYGSSEETLGQIGVAGMRIVTKLPGLPSGAIDPNVWVRDQVLESISRLRISRLYGLLLHRPAQLLGDRGRALYEALLLVKSEKLVEKIGVSIYCPGDLVEIWPRFDLDIIQSPYNVFDRRLSESGLLSRLLSARVECHVRSVFLQGLLVLDPERRPDKFLKWSKTIAVYDAWVRDTGLTRMEACVRFALSLRGIERVVVGVDSSAQMKMLLDIADSHLSLNAPTFGLIDPMLVNPGKWDTV